MRPYLEKPFRKIGLVEWLKVKALSSRPVLQKKKKKVARTFLASLFCDDTQVSVPLPSQSSHACASSPSLPLFGSCSYRKGRGIFARVLCK
jgi:hypothetical protein